MRLQNTQSSEDRILDSCASFGGLASEAAEIAERLDSVISERDSTIKELEIEVDELKSRIAELEGGQP